MGLTRRSVLLAAALLLAAAGVPEPDGYRMDDYRAPTPDTLRDATVATTADMRELVAQGAVLIDVLPAPRRPESMRPGVPWLPTPHHAIPGSLWLPTIGYGVISPAAEEQLDDILSIATAGRRDAPVVFYCRAECWMSWNAARRAVAAGWRGVVWYPDGIDGWTAAGLPTQEVQPELVD